MQPDSTILCGPIAQHYAFRPHNAIRFTRTTLCDQDAQGCADYRGAAEGAFAAFFPTEIGGLSTATRQGTYHELLVIVDGTCRFETSRVVDGQRGDISLALRFLC